MVVIPFSYIFGRSQQRQSSRSNAGQDARLPVFGVVDANSLIAHLIYRGRLISHLLSRSPIQLP